MSYYDQKKAELEDTLKKLKETQGVFDKAFEALKKEKIKIEEDKSAVMQLAKERQMGFPWLAKAYDEYFELQDKSMVNFLKYKEHPALKASEIVDEYSKMRRAAEKKERQARHIINLYESVAPFLIDFREETEIDENEEGVFYDWDEDEKQDPAINYLTKDEYRKLSSAEKNQLALDRFLERGKSNRLIGRLYERYIGYLYEEKGFDVQYIGAIKGVEDLGRDLLCRKGREVIIIQCKNWSQFKTIFEKHIFQFFGTVYEFQHENPSLKVKAIFVTTTSLSELARRFAHDFGIQLDENHKFDKNYPCIKCNIGQRSSEKIYHLPFDQQYDKIKIEKDKGEFYCKTVVEAEAAGFRRAFRYKGIRK